MTARIHLLGFVRAGNKSLHRIASLAQGKDMPRYGLPLHVMASADIVIDLTRQEFIKCRAEDVSKAVVTPTLMFLFENCPLERIVTGTGDTYSFAPVDL